MKKKINGLDFQRGETIFHLITYTNTHTKTLFPLAHIFLRLIEGEYDDELLNEMKIEVYIETLIFSIRSIVCKQLFSTQHESEQAGIVLSNSFSHEHFLIRLNEIAFTWPMIWTWHRLPAPIWSQ